MKFPASRIARAVPLVALALLLASCGDKITGAKPGPMPDFHLLDVNPASATSGDSVSPRQKLGGISAWYFGSAG